MSEFSERENDGFSQFLNSVNSDADKGSQVKWATVFIVAHHEDEWIGGQRNSCPPYTGFPVTDAIANPSDSTC
jgi:hypothetical protein